MTSSDKTTLVTALNLIKVRFNPGFGIRTLINKLISDLDAISLGAGGTTDLISSFQVDPVSTVAGLPVNPAPVLNDEAIVTDATAAANGNIVAGGGAVRVMVRWDGAAWRVV